MFTTLTLIHFLGFVLMIVFMLFIVLPMILYTLNSLVIFQEHNIFKVFGANYILQEVKFYFSAFISFFDVLHASSEKLNLYFTRACIVIAQVFDKVTSSIIATTTVG